VRRPAPENATTLPPLSRRLLGRGALLAIAFGLLMFIALHETLTRAVENRVVLHSELLLHSVVSETSTLSDQRDLACIVSAMSAATEVLGITVTAGSRVVAADESALLGAPLSSLDPATWRLPRSLTRAAAGGCALLADWRAVTCAARARNQELGDGIFHLRVDAARIRAVFATLLRQIFGWTGGLIVTLLAALFAPIKRQVVRPDPRLTRAAGLPDFRLRLRDLDAIRCREIAELADALRRTSDNQREVALQLKEISSRFDLAIDGAAEVIWDTDLVADRCYCAPRLAGLLGLRLADLATAAASFDALLHPDDLA
jgi:PAS domain-containing protein